MLVIEYTEEDGGVHIEPFEGMRQDASGRFYVNGTFVTPAVYDEVLATLRSVASRTVSPSGGCMVLRFGE